MGKRGPKPRGKVKIRWSSDFAYAIGLLTTDGCVSSDGYHVLFGSKDLEQVKNLIQCLGISNKIGKNVAGHKKSFSYRVQFGDIIFWNFLVDIGIGPAKSKTIGKIDIPSKFFFDFLRGSFDGDGSIHSYYDPRWKSSFMFYTSFVSASKKHIDWLRLEIESRVGIKGHVTKSRNSPVFQLKYAKRESVRLLEKMFADPKAVSLKRKRLKIKKILDIVG